MVRRPPVRDNPHAVFSGRYDLLSSLIEQGGVSTLPSAYGCDAKMAHNVSGLNGVMNGTPRDLWTSLLFQMIGIHEAIRLTFVVEANPALVNAIVQRHRALQKLFGAHRVVLDFDPANSCGTSRLGMATRTDRSTCPRYMLRGRNSTSCSSHRYMRSARR